MKVWREFTFSAAHKLTGTEKKHKCSGIHGHNFRVRFIVEGERDEKTGFVIDFHDLDVLWNGIVFMVDHMDLNTVMDNPTSENIAEYIHGAVRPRLPKNLQGGFSVEVMESERSGARYP